MSKIKLDNIFCISNIITVIFNYIGYPILLMISMLFTGWTDIGFLGKGITFIYIMFLLFLFVFGVYVIIYKWITNNRKDSIYLLILYVLLLANILLSSHIFDIMTYQFDSVKPIIRCLLFGASLIGNWNYLYTRSSNKE